MNPEDWHTPNEQRTHIKAPDIPSVWGFINFAAVTSLENHKHLAVQGWGFLFAVSRPEYIFYILTVTSVLIFNI